MNGPRRHLALYLRLNALILLPAFAAAVMPADWLAGIHARLGLGELPATPVVLYLARSESLLYGGFGILAVYLSLDVDRYLPLLGLLGWLAILLGAAFLALDFGVGLPLWWTGGEAPLVALLGAALLLLVRRVTPRSGS